MNAIIKQTYAIMINVVIITTINVYIHYIVNSRYLKDEAYPNLLISHSNFSVPKKFALTYK